MEDAGGRPPRFWVRRERLTLALAAPLAGLFLASAVSWPWLAAGLPGAFGSLTPPGIVILAVVVFAGAFAIRRRLPMALLTWPPAGQGAIVLLTTGFLARGGEELAGAAALVAYAVIYLFVLVFAISLSRHGAALPVAFTALFVGTQALRFPVFETAEPAISGAAPFTLAAAALALAELAALTWAARRFVSAPEEGAMRAAALIVGVAALHGALAGWQGPLLVGELSVGAAAGQALRWLGLVVVQVGLVWAAVRLRRAFAHFERTEYVPEAALQRREEQEAQAEPSRDSRPASSTEQGLRGDDGGESRDGERETRERRAGGRPTRRKRRRR
ncbi:MAG: hypothetical protein OXI25_00080 [Chloroflexota bacterium]|nr:hypothetical protein [Chloroflexota bacterium]